MLLYVVFSKSFSSFSEFLIRIFGLFPFSANHSVNARNVEEASPISTREW